MQGREFHLVISGFNFQFKKVPHLSCEVSSDDRCTKSFGIKLSLELKKRHLISHLNVFQLY